MSRNKFEAFNYRCAVSLDENSALLCLCPPRSIKGYLHILVGYPAGSGGGGEGGKGSIYAKVLYVRETGLT